MSSRKVLKILVGFGTLFLLAVASARCFPHQVLTVDCGPVKADVLVVLGGGSFERPDWAAELFKGDEAPKIILSGQGDSELHKRWLLAAGVPELAIEVEDGSTTTRENAQFTIAMLRAQASKHQTHGQGNERQDSIPDPQPLSHRLGEGGVGLSRTRPKGPRQTRSARCA